MNKIFLEQIKKIKADILRFKKSKKIQKIITSFLLRQIIFTSIIPEILLMIN